MPFIKVLITKYISDAQPGIVECELIDVHGKKWIFIDKVPIFSEDIIDAHTNYPVDGLVKCNILHISEDNSVITVNTKPWGVISNDDTDQFEVSPSSLTELDSESHTEASIQSKKSWHTQVGYKSATLSEWAHILSPVLGRGVDEISKRGLSAYDFPRNAPVEIEFIDGSTARFFDAFFVVDEEFGRVGIFTEHCGYWDLPAWGLKVTMGFTSFIGPYE